MVLACSAISSQRSSNAGGQKGYEAIALTYARQAERLLEDKDRPAVRKRVLDALASALTKAGKADEAKEVEARGQEDRFHDQNGAVRRTKGQERSRGPGGAVHRRRASAEHGRRPGLDALGKTFKPSEVVRLQYHLHVPGPDPLTNRDSEARVRFYRRVVESLPSVLLNGDSYPSGAAMPRRPGRFTTSFSRLCRRCWRRPPRPTSKPRSRARVPRSASMYTYRT